MSENESELEASSEDRDDEHEVDEEYDDEEDVDDDEDEEDDDESLTDTFGGEDSDLDGSGSEDEEEKELGGILYPNAWQLIFRQRLREEFEPWPAPPGSEVLNPFDVRANMFLNVSNLEEFRDPDDENFFTFRITFPSDVDSQDRDIAPIVFKQLNHPNDREVDAFDPCEAPIDEYRAFANSDLGLHAVDQSSIDEKDEEIDCVYMFGDILLGQRRPFLFGQLKGWTVDTKPWPTRHIEMEVLVPAIAKFPLLNNAADLDSDEDLVLEDEAKVIDGCLKLVGNCRSFGTLAYRKGLKSLRTGFCFSMWFQQGRMKDVSYLMSRSGPKEGISLSTRHVEGEGLVLRGTVKTSQAVQSIQCLLKPSSEMEQKLDGALADFDTSEDFTWYHVIFQFDGADHTLQLWLNGKKQDVVAADGFLLHKNDDIIVGGIPDSVDDRNFFHGRIYDFCVYGRCLSDYALESLYDCGLTRQLYVRTKYNERKKSEMSPERKFSKRFFKLQQKQRSRRASWAETTPPFVAPPAAVNEESDSDFF